MKSVVELKATRTFAGPGMYAYDADARVRDENDKELYVHVNAYDMFHVYTVSETSTYAFATNETDVDPEAEYLEYYENKTDAKQSAYWRVFDKLNGMITLIMKGI